jgi:CHAT domain-containing protein/tetratricopeptide (TPR) repeat protein
MAITLIAFILVSDAARAFDRSSDGAVSYASVSLADPEVASVDTSPLDPSEIDAAFAAAHTLIVSRVPVEAEAEWLRLQGVLKTMSDQPSARLGEAQRWRSAALFYGQNVDAALVEAEEAIATFRTAKDATVIKLADAIEWKGHISLHRGRLNEARALFEEARVILASALPPSDPEMFGIDAAIASVDRRAGRYEDLVRRMQPALAAVQDSLPIADATVMSARMQLAMALAETGERNRALAEYRRAYADSRAQRGLADTFTVLAAESLAMFELAQGNELEATAMFEEALVQRQSGIGLPFELAASWGMNGLAALSLDRPDKAEAAFLNSISGFERAVGPESRVVMISLRNAASSAAAQGDFDRAIAYLDRALGIAIVLNADALIVGQIKLGLAEYQSALTLGEATTTAEEALSALRSVRPSTDFDVMRAEVTAGWVAARQGDLGIGIQRIREVMPGLEMDLSVKLAVSGAPAPPRDMRNAFGQALETAFRADDVETGFRAAQILIETDTARAAAAAGARIGGRSDALAEALRTHQENAARRQRLDRAYSAAIPSGDEGLIAAARAAVGEAQADYLASRARLDRDFPEVGSVLGSDVVSVAQAQSRLAPGEALVLPLLTHDSLYVFALTATSVDWERTEIDRQEIAGLVTRLRAADEPAYGLRRDGVDALTPARGTVSSFDRDAAQALYRAIFTPVVAATTRDSDTLIFAAGRDFAPVSWAALITGPGTPEQPAWLIRSVAVQVAPSVSALRRDVVRVDRADTLFAAGAAVFGDAADGSALKSLVDLPQARVELDALEAAFPASRVFRGHAATETIVRTSDLTGVDVLVLATHGLMAGELPGLSEPALAFTPGETSSDRDDGLLTASEVTALKLDADWVVLSACNTAAGDRPGAAGFTGLARAFLFAGAQNVLVSHWPVRDDAAARMTVATIEASAGGSSPAQALRTAMLALMDDPSVPGGADPSVWAAFTLVGS